MKSKIVQPHSNLKDQKGVTTVQIILGLAIIGILAGVAAKVLVPLFQKTEQNGAFDEIHIVAIAVREVKTNTGSFAPLANFEYLTDNGYIDSPSYTDGVNQNVYGQNITAVRATGNATATVTYVFRNNPQCLNMVDRLSQISFLSGVSCTSGTLTTTIS